MLISTIYTSNSKKIHKKLSLKFFISIVMESIIFNYIHEYRRENIQEYFKGEDTRICQ